MPEALIAMTKLSLVDIDVDKDWRGHVIKNLGAPVDSNDSLRLAELNSHKETTPIDHPDGSVTMAKVDPAWVGIFWLGGF